jgi:integration host factor subunit beta
MLRSDLMHGLAKRNSTLNAGKLARMVDAIFEAIATHLAKNGRVELRGLGSFSTRLRTARRGINPRTRERVEVRAKRLVYFRAGRQMREAINADVGTTKAAEASRPPHSLSVPSRQSRPTARAEWTSLRTFDGRDASCRRSRQSRRSSLAT